MYIYIYCKYTNWSTVITASIVTRHTVQRFCVLFHHMSLKLGAPGGNFKQLILTTQ